jgi:predicted O-methyltransferase YrrM
MGWRGDRRYARPMIRRSQLSPLRPAMREAVRAAVGSWSISASTSEVQGFTDVWYRTDAIPGWFSEVSAAAFWGVISTTRPRTVVEIGSYLGRSTVFLGLAVKSLCGSDSRLVSIDPHTGDRQLLEGLGLDRLGSLDLFRLHVAGAGISDVLDARVARSEEVGAAWAEPVDLLFVDGWHSYDAVRSDLRNFGANLSDQGIVCCDDFVRYPDVRRAVLDGCDELGLVRYGIVAGQAWAGRNAEPPPALARAIRVHRRAPVGPGGGLAGMRRLLGHGRITGAAFEFR